MTKTTSYEISKKLKEAGFEAEADYNFIERNNQKAFLVNIKELSGIEIMNEIGVFIKSYDLETLIDALPDSIIREYKSKVNWEVKAFRERLIIEKKEIRYSCDDIENADDANRYFNEFGYMQELSIYNFKFNNESLADTAGKMWLLLKEKGLIC